MNELNKKAMPASGLLQSHSTDISAGSPTHVTSRSCSVMETKAMKLPVYSFCADVNVRAGL